MIESIYATGSYSGISGAGAIDQRRAEMFHQVDTNSDNGVDQVEFSEFAKQMSKMSGISVNTEEVFSEYDASGDGLLSDTEMGVFMKDNAPSPPSGGMMTTQAGPDKAGKARPSSEELFTVVDSDSDGQIIQSEFEAFIQEVTDSSGTATDAEDVFAAYDANGDSSLDADELSSFMKDNAPPPPSASSREEQRAVSGYGMNMNTEQLTSLLNSLTNGTTDGASATEEVSALTSDYAAKLMEIINLRTSGSNGSSRISIMT